MEKGVNSTVVEVDPKFRRTVDVDVLRKITRFFLHFTKSTWERPDGKSLEFGLLVFMVRVL